MKTASLNSSLLTRKGAAAPATFLPPAEAPKPGGQPTAPLLATRGAPAVPPKPARPAPNGGRRARSSERTRLSLRLDREQHLKIRLASVHLGKSAQAIVLAALERYLQEVAPTLGGGSCHCLGAGAPGGGSGTGGVKTASAGRAG